MMILDALQSLIEKAEGLSIEHLGNLVEQTRLDVGLSQLFPGSELGEHFLDVERLLGIIRF
jgi:hypothetical protein